MSERASERTGGFSEEEKLGCPFLVRISWKGEHLRVVCDRDRAPWESICRPRAL